MPRFAPACGKAHPTTTSADFFPVSTSPADHEKYNPVFELLVDNEEDKITGYVAYALYKQKKRDWIVDFKERRGTPPSDAEFDEYNKAECLPRNLEMLRRDAQSVLAAYSTEIVAAELESLKEKARNDVEQGRLDAALRTIEAQNSFSRQVGVALVSTLLTTIILIIIAVALALFGVDVFDGAARLRTESVGP